MEVTDTEWSMAELQFGWAAAVQLAERRAALRSMTVLDGSRDGGCAWLDNRRRFELVRDDEDGAQHRRVAQGRRPRLAPWWLEEVISQGGGSVRQMGMAAWGYGAVLWTAAVLLEWRGVVGFERRAWR
jgi:hypothetical protein